MKHAKKIDTTSCGACVVKYVDNEPHVLLVKPRAERDRWGVPKGHIEPGETPTQCAVREVIEETGVAPLLLEEMGSVKVIHGRERKTVKIWLAHPIDHTTEPVKSDENVEVRYWPVSNLPDIHIYQRPLMAQLVEVLSMHSREVFSEAVKTAKASST
jgi:8-oxo-dGTP pyrophosphatase MutT (NUDIX family)